MEQDAWKNFELSGKVSDYLAYRQGGRQEAKKSAAAMERGMGSYGTEHCSDGDRIKCNADWRLR